MIVQFGDRKFACDGCGTAIIDIPEWTDDRSMLSCQTCGKPVGTIRHILGVLQAALVDNENEPADAEQGENIRRP